MTVMSLKTSHFVTLPLTFISLLYLHYTLVPVFFTVIHSLSICFWFFFVVTLGRTERDMCPVADDKGAHRPQAGNVHKLKPKGKVKLSLYLTN
jgi:hypothetical protein